MDQMRSEFEAWMEHEHLFYGEDFKWEEERNCYAQYGIHLAWEAWKGSRAAIELDLPKKYYSESYLGNGCCDDYANDKLDEVYSVVRAAGLRVKEK